MAITEKPMKLVNEIMKARRYTVKFVCGSSDGSLLAKGDYATVITLHNPHAEEVRFRRKLTVSMPAEKPGLMSNFTFGSIVPEGVLEINGTQIIEEVDLPQGKIYTGFVFLEALAQLNVAAIHTTAGAGGHIVTFKIEDVTPSIINLKELVKLPSRRLPDLIPLPAFPSSSRGKLRKLPQNYCFSTVGEEKADAIRIIVRNQGKGDAPKSITAVQFKGQKPVRIETPAIAAGDETTIEVKIPYECLAEESEYLFEITVNATGTFDEANKENNKASGSCRSWR